jgi:hypothetical protein
MGGFTTVQSVGAERDSDLREQMEAGTIPGRKGMQHAGHARVTAKQICLTGYLKAQGRARTKRVSGRWNGRVEPQRPI